MTVSRRHDHLEELLAADALGGLDESDRSLLAREIREHGPDCPVCLQLIAEYSEVASHLALSLEPVPLTAGAEHRLLEAATGSETHVSEPEPSTAESARMIRIRPGRTRRWIAAVLAAAVVGGVGGFLLAQPRPQGIQVVELAGASGQHLAVVFQPGQADGWVIGSDIPDPGAGRVYELWFRQSGSSKMEPAGTFRPRGGSVAAPARLARKVDLLAVTIEPAPGTEAPTSDPIFASAIPAD